MDREAIKQLLNKYIAGKASGEEKAWIETWYNHHQTRTDAPISERRLKKDLEAVRRSLPAAEAKTYRLPWLRIAAACALLVCGAGLYFYLTQSPERPVLAGNPPPAIGQDIGPGSNKATLTLEDGSIVSLDDSGNGSIAERNGVRISKTATGALLYTALDRRSTGEQPDGKQPTAYNTVSTPRGGQYQIVLPDKTIVWLNAASSLRYPTAFTGSRRKVSLKGEAYFEVQPDKEMPFIVVTEEQELEVLGTKFNINSYRDEPAVRTTLVEGSVKVTEKASSSTMILAPGEQASLSENAFSVTEVDIGHEIAWKNGLFQFQGTNIRSVMRQLSRWYDVDVEFEGKIPDIQLWGEVYRDVSAAQALEILEYFNLKYKITEAGSRKKIIIY